MNNRPSTAGLEAGPPPLGRLLRDWRQVRGMSQLSLALDAGVSARHVSFIESGRATPSREMIILLANTLNIPLRERNALLEAAGYASVYREIGRSAPELELAQKALELILTKQEPYPAVIMDRYWNVQQANNAATRFFDLLLSGKNVSTPPNIIRLMFDPDGIRPYVANWEEVAVSLLLRMRREVLGGVLDEKSRSLMDEALSFPNAPRRLVQEQFDLPLSPIVVVKFRKNGLSFDFFSTVTTLGTPQDISLQETRIECFFPANEATVRAVEESQWSEAAKARE